MKSPTKKATPLLIPYGRFSKVIIYYLARNNNIHRRPDSAVHYTGDDYVLGNLKFVPKGETVEVFGMAIPDPLITEAIQQSSYYPNYLKMVAANTKKTPRESASVQPATKRATPKKKPQTSTTFRDKSRRKKGEGDDADLELAIKLSLDPALLPQRQAPIGGVTIRDPVSEATPKLHEVVGKGKAIVSEEQVAHSLIDLSKKKRSTDQFILARRDQSPPDSTTGPSSRPDDDTSEKVIHESSSTSDSERTESDTESGTPKGDKVQGEIVSSTVTSGVSIPVSVPEKAHEAQAGPDPEPMQEDRLIWTLENSYVNFKETIITLRVARLEQEMSEVKKTDVLASIRSQVPTAVDNYLGTKLDDCFIEAKKEQAEEKQDSTYSIRSTDEVDIEDSDSGIKTSMDKDVADEGPSAGSKPVGTKRRRSESAASGSSAKPPPKADDQSSKKTRESEASASKQHQSLSSTGWQITDTREAGVDSSMHRSDPESEHSKQSSDDISMQDEGNVSDMEDTDNAHIPKVSTTTWFKPIPESERPATPEPEWTIPPNDFPEPEHNWANAYATSYKVPEENKLQRKTYDIGDKERKIALSISKLKAARYLDFGLEELVPSLWVESEQEYDISAVYGITHWWFRRKEFYTTKIVVYTDREAVRSQMRILSVISVKVFEKYGYNYLREIILRRADYQEYKISERDFKNLHPNDFEDLFLLNIQEKLNHLPKTDKISLQPAFNMWIKEKPVHKGMEIGSGQRMTREEAKTSSQYREVPTDQKDLSKVGKLGTILTISARTEGFYQDNPLVSVEVLSETIAVHNEDGNPARANIKQAPSRNILKAEMRWNIA
ncbi:hypothetical protein Tco_0613045 [Tanacetum coccineum]